MNTQLIPVFTATIGNLPVNAVDARVLHAFLDVPTGFRNWIVRRIEEYGFQEGIDFCSFQRESSGGRPAKEYHLSIDMAKVVSAVERNKRGHAVLASLSKNSVFTSADLFSLIQDIDLPNSDDLFVYAIREVETGRVKIGISKNPSSRLKQLQTGNPNTLEISAIIEADSFSDERAAHTKVIDHHIRGEWFKAEALTLLHG
jgi:phage anti-repressor protein